MKPSIRQVLSLVIVLGIVAEVFAQIPAGYYNATENLFGSKLKAKLHDIIDDHTELNYEDAYKALVILDRDPADPSKVIGIYSGFKMDGPAMYASGKGWNREHVWPKSHGDFGTTKGAGTDLHHLRAEDVSTNSARNNRSFTNGGQIYTDASGTPASASREHHRTAAKEHDRLPAGQRRRIPQELLGSCASLGFVFCPSR